MANIQPSPGIVPDPILGRMLEHSCFFRSVYNFIPLPCWTNCGQGLVLVQSQHQLLCCLANAWPLYAEHDQCTKVGNLPNVTHFRFDIIHCKLDIGS